MEILKEYMVVIGWGITAAITMSFSMAIVFAIFTKLTPNLDEVEELKKQNIAVGIVLGSLLIATGIVIAAGVVPLLNGIIAK